MKKVSAFVAAAVLAGHCLCAQPGWTADSPSGTGGVEASGSKPDLTQGSLSAYDLPAVTAFGVADQPPTVPVQTRFGTQYNVVTEEQIRLQNSLDFYDALRNVPGVMYQKKNIIGGQTSASLYVRGRGASHPSPDINIYFDDVPRSGVLYGQALADGIPVYALGGMEIYKYPQPSRFGSGYAMLNFIPKYMTKEGYEFRIGAEGGSYGTVAENVGMGAKKDNFDIYAAQSFISTLGHKEHTAAYQTSYYGNMGIALSDNWTLRMMANRVDAQTQAPSNPITNTRERDRFDTQTSLATLSLINKYKNANGYLKGYYNDTLFYLRGDSYDKSTSVQTNNLYGLRARETYSVWEGSEIINGVDFDITDLRNDQRFYATNATTSWEFPQHRMLSPYAAISQMFGSKNSFHITPSAGLRLYTSNLFEDKAAPQAGLVLGYNNSNLAFNYSRGVNYPSPVVLQGLLANKTSLPSGLNTKDIHPEVVDHYEVSLSHNQPGLFTVSATAFHDDGRDRLRAYMATAGRAPTADFFTSSTAEYKIDGLELSGSLTPTENLELFAGATWMKTWAKGDNGITTSTMPYTPAFALQTGFKWKFYDNFQLSGDYQYLKDVYAATWMRGASPAAPASNVTTLNEINRLPDINVFNARIDYTFSYDDMHLEEGKVYLAVNNIFNTPYAYSMEVSGNNRGLYNMPGTTFMVGFDLKF